ncbi:hypothetical protein BDV25DRAFT_150978 [Aspergillus avenaceus]|uniref:WW domain-containing protein n=1 Tax=Aspergillus avenaceus TaxID=36643 RepID=A0A5N6U1T6_ASPAV|nr:hypothetical protein BDV25DRAFT_150978 [Aspergillus avenaceus]
MPDTPPNPATDNPSTSPEKPERKSKEDSPGQTSDRSEDTPERETQKGKDREDGEHEDDDDEEQTSDGQEEEGKEASAPPLPDEEIPPPLPNEAPPGEDDGWEPVWDANVGSYYFYNRFTGMSQWENPRVPDTAAGPPGADDGEKPAPAPVVGGYNPAIHGDYDPTAPYAQQYEQPPEETAAGAPGIEQYAAVGAFNRFTGRWQSSDQNPENHNDQNKSYRQMNAFFDVDAAANSHDGRSLRAERSAKKLTKKELKMFKEKRREKKEEKRRAWLRD